jgi:hypothetical protein
MLEKSKASDPPFIKDPSAGLTSRKVNENSKKTDGVTLHLSTD